MFPGVTAGIFLFKVNNENTKTMCKKFTIKTLERHHCCPSGASVVNFEKISHIVLLFPLLTFNK